MSKCVKCEDIMICDSCYESYCCLNCMADAGHTPCNTCGNISCDSTLRQHWNTGLFICDTCDVVSCLYCNIKVIETIDPVGNYICLSCKDKHPEEYNQDASDSDDDKCHCGAGKPHVKGGIFCRG